MFNYIYSMASAEAEKLIAKPEEQPEDVVVLNISMHEAWFRVLTYSFLILTVASGVILTMMYNVKVEQGGGWTPDSHWELVDLEDNPLYNIFGYNNVCVFFDTLPGKYISLWFFELTMIFFACYVIASHFNLVLAYKRKHYTDAQLNVFRVTLMFDLLVFTYAVEIFAVTPKENFVMHTLPFSALIMGIIAAGVRNVFHNLSTVDYKKSSCVCLRPYMRNMEYLYGILLVVISVWKLTVQYRGVILLSSPAPKWGRLSDSLFMLFAVAIPWAHSVVKLCAPNVFPQGDHMLHITISNFHPDKRKQEPCPCCATQNAVEKQE